MTKSFDNSQPVNVPFVIQSVKTCQLFAAANVTVMIDNSVFVVMKLGNYELYLNDAKFGNHDFINCLHFFEY